MPTKSIELQFPQGVARRLGLRVTSRGREGYPAPWSINVRLEDSLTNRLRGGNFTGISAGSRPSEILYRDRKLTFTVNKIFASRVGNHDDITLSSDISDMIRPVLFQFSDASEVGGTVVALIPHKDRFLLGFTADETWIQHGDPNSGPRHRISDQVGIIGANAWCVNHDTVYFLSSSGLYSVQADGSDLTPISEDVLPEDLTGVTDSDCTLTYQHSDRGVYIHKTGTDWFYDTARRQFWPFDTNETDSHILIGPIKLGTVDSLGLIQTIHGIVAESSDSVSWAIVPGKTAEEAASNGKAAITLALADGNYSSYVRGSGTWTSGRSMTDRPRTQSMWAVIWLSSTGNWAYEGITLGIERSGSWRK